MARLDQTQVAGTGLLAGALRWCDHRAMRAAPTTFALLTCLACTTPRPPPAAPPPPRALATRAHRMAADCVASPDAAAVLCGGRPFAALLCFTPEGRTCRALAVRYADELTWLYRPPGFDPAHPEQFQAPAEKDALRAFNPSVAWDGRLVWFGARPAKGRGLVHEYDVQSGELRTLEKSAEWKVWADEPAHRALPITAAAPPVPGSAAP